MAEKVAGPLNLGVGRYAEQWQTMRRTAHAILTPNAVAGYLPVQRAEATQVLYDLLKTPRQVDHHDSDTPSNVKMLRPQNFYTHLSRYSNSTIMSVLYGKRCPRYKFYGSIAFYKSMQLWNQALEPGAFPPVDMLPILDWIPEMSRVEEARQGS
ncbi:hypothetical protein V5O48_014104 [Marasmius crinis-equi]|uniref:Uncharacterized protein n=1 Tax=Marasmius crinis-equi TaxID=585013 RepID=A0ABR3EY83_9AGAR